MLSNASVFPIPGNPTTTQVDRIDKRPISALIGAIFTKFQQRPQIRPVTTMT